MNMTPLKSSVLLPLTCASLLTLYACEQVEIDSVIAQGATKTEVSERGAGNSDAATAPVDKPIDAYQVALLDFAFQTASAIPVEPHIKDKCKAQEAVVTACLALDQPQRALGFLEQIKDWRRGCAYADLAFYSIGRGEKSQVQSYLQKATEVSETTEDWRRDRIRVKVARTHALLGETALATELEAGVVNSESGKVNGVRAMTATDDDFDTQMAAVDEFVASKNFDLVKNALDACVQLFKRFYDTQARQTLVEQKVKSSWDVLPGKIRIELMIELSRVAVYKEDSVTAGRLLDEIKAMADDFNWEAGDYVVITSRIATLRAQSGNKSAARAEIETALSMFNAQRETIGNIHRADALQPLAEAYKAIGDLQNTLGVYKLAAEESMVNPNSRPRAEDTSLIATSMALNAVEPDSELWARLQEIFKGLSDPW